MAEKTSRKQRRLIQADLNFISEHNLGIIAARLENPVPKNIFGEVMAVDEDTVAFLLRYQREERETAVVKGILQRWAGDMTHIYCEGRTFRRQRSAQDFIRLVYQSMIVFLLMLGGEILLYVFFGMWLPAAYFGLLVGLTLIALVFTGVIVGWRELMRFLVNAPDEDPLFEFSPQPEAKDRERLLDYLADVIHDGAVHSVDRLVTNVTANTDPLVMLHAIPQAQHTAKNENSLEVGM